VAAVGKLVQKYERDSYIEKDRQYKNRTQTQNTQNKKIHNKKTK